MFLKVSSTYHYEKEGRACQFKISEREYLSSTGFSRRLNTRKTQSFSQPKSDCQAKGKLEKVKSKDSQKFKERVFNPARKFFTYTIN